MPYKISPATPEDVEQVLVTRYAKYPDIHLALMRGASIRVETGSKQEACRIRSALSHWAARKGIRIDTRIADHVLIVVHHRAAPAQSLPEPEPPPAPLPQKRRGRPPAPLRGKAPADDWERMRRPPSPPTWEELMGGKDREGGGDGPGA